MTCEPFESGDAAGRILTPRIKLSSVRHIVCRDRFDAAAVQFHDEFNVALPLYGLSAKKLPAVDFASIMWTKNITQ